MDTPGLISNRYARSLGMSREFTADPFRSMMEADLGKLFFPIQLLKRNFSLGGGGGGGGGRFLYGNNN